MKVLVTGGTGFLGGAVVRLLLGRGDRVRSFNRSTSAELERLGVEQVAGDLADPGAVRGRSSAAMPSSTPPPRRGSGARRGTTGAPERDRDPASHRRLPLRGGRQADLHQLPERRLRRLRPGGDRRVDPLSGAVLAHYPASKAEAERRVLAANGPGLLTVAPPPAPDLGARRPPADPEAPGTRPLGEADPRGDAAEARRSHLHRRCGEGAPAGARCADGPGSSPRGACVLPLAGGAGASVGLDRAHPGLRRACPRSVRTISPAQAYVAGALMEAAWRVFRLDGEPPFTRFLARQFTTAHWFEIGAARRDLGYLPELTTEEGLRRLGDALRGASR
jgi:hypothetical protein